MLYSIYAIKMCFMYIAEPQVNIPDDISSKDFGTYVGFLNRNTQRDAEHPPLLLLALAMTRPAGWDCEQTIGTGAVFQRHCGRSRKCHVVGLECYNLWQHLHDIFLQAFKFSCFLLLMDHSFVKVFRS